MEEYTSEDNGKIIHLKNWKSGFKVTLDENPTTGYVWEVVQLPDQMKMTKSDLMLSDTKLAGSAALHIFHFSVTKETEGKLALKNCRPWDKTDTIDSFELTFEINEK